MPRGINITKNGSNIILQNLNKEIKRIKGATRIGLKLGSTLVEGESKMRTPVDTGNLVGGHYVAEGEVNGKITAEIGLQADYAIYVHENLTNAHPVGEARFLYNAFVAKAPDVLKIIQRTAKIR